ncbi:uncharacterized protein LOC143426880 [Xylocopa sonorina]|uniref:uncharacterized protein LOC143426880 n=1 Tax=Xylocopa sonorina TaxID=1818115 RepID=UPI00403ACC58
MIGYLLIHCWPYNSESIVGPVGTLWRQVQLFRVTECTLFLPFKIYFSPGAIAIHCSYRVQRPIHLYRRPPSMMEEKFQTVFHRSQKNEKRI